MEALFEFISGNLYVFLIIFAILSSLLTRGKQRRTGGEPGNGRAGAPNTGRPNFGGEVTRELRKFGSEIFGEDSENKPAPSRPIAQQPRYGANPLSSRTEPIPAEVDHSKSREIPATSPKRTNTNPTVATEINSENSPIYHPFLDGDVRKRAVEGMKWAEVFGKPRAYARHGRRR